MQEKILNAAFKLAAKDGLRKLTRSKVAKGAQCAPGLVSYYFRPDGMGGLRSAVVKRAIELENLGILAEALTEKHPTAIRASRELKLKALSSVVA